jgi:hypothetical protein
MPLAYPDREGDPVDGVDRRFRVALDECLDLDGGAVSGESLLTPRRVYASN